MLILADDLTGAADTGVAFAQRGLRTLLRLKRDVDIGDPTVIVISSGSRNGSASEAARLVRSCLGQAHPPIYKKIDSVLRGHVATELLATMAALGVERALVAPAFPAQARITRGGMQYVNGQVIARSLLEELHHQTQLPIRIASLHEVMVDPMQLHNWLTQPGIVIADAETDQHLDSIATLAQQTNVPVWCGSAGLAHALARQMALPGQISHKPITQPVLIVSGSYHAQTEQQLDYLHAHKMTMVALHHAATDPIQVCVQALSARRSVALTRPATTVDLQHSQLIADELGNTTRQILAQLSFLPRFILTGGDTALAVCHALEATAIELLHEIEPGIPVGQIVGGIADGATLITKSGGFGDAQTLWRALSGR